MSKENNLLQSLVGKQLSALAMDEDHVKLDFEGNRLNLYEWPLLVAGNNDYEYGSHEYNAVWNTFLENKVTKVVLEEGVLLSLYFDKGSIKVHLAEDEELAYFSGTNGDWIAF